MADRFFPANTPDEEAIQKLSLVRYYPVAPKNTAFFDVKVMNVVSRTSVHPTIIKVPVFYYEHLRRFVWRHHVFMEIVERRLEIPYVLETMVKRYIMYLDGMVEGLLTTARKRKGIKTYRSKLFNQYLIVEYFVGRHEYDVAGYWRLKNPETILECQDIQEIDWESFYAKKDEEDPIWSGVDYGFETINVPENHWKMIANAASTTFFKFHLQDATGVTTATKRRRGKGTQKGKKAAVDADTESDSEPMGAHTKGGKGLEALPSASKKRKVSGISGLELDLALNQPRKLRSSIIVEKAPGSDPAPAETLDSMISTLESRVNNPLLSFSAADDKALERFNIVRKGLLYLQPEATLREAITASRTVGSNKLWSSDNMYKHLSFLISSFTNKNETSSRMVIDTFFFRSTAMVPSPRKAIVMLENQVSAVHPRLSQISGMIDYTAVVAESHIAESYIYIPPTLSQRYGGEMTAFLATEAKGSAITIPLEGYLPRILLQLVACAKRLGKSHIRGALTTGFKWHFVVVDLDADGDGAEYWVSEPIEWKWKTKRSLMSIERFVEETSDESDPALIAGILASWITESLTEFNGDQWFIRRSGGGCV